MNKAEKKDGKWNLMESDTLKQGKEDKAALAKADIMKMKDLAAVLLHIVERLEEVEKRK